MYDRRWTPKSYARRGGDRRSAREWSSKSETVRMKYENEQRAEMELQESKHEASYIWSIIECRNYNGLTP